MNQETISTLTNIRNTSTMIETTSNHSSSYSYSITKNEVNSFNNSNNKLNKRKINELMEEKVNEGMEKSIEITNKGFQLLQKFGYIEGGLGKNNNGIENPIKIIKRENNNKSGIGIENDTKRLNKKIKDKVTEFIRNSDLEAGFLAAVKHRKRCQQIKYEIKCCENAIETLDLKNNVARHNLWPISLEENLNNNHNCNSNHRIDNRDDDYFDEYEDEDEDNGDNSNENKQEDYIQSIQRLECCIQYLRSTYRYCVYCGNDFDNWEDMEENCPGPLKEDH
mmetsp:Transcript_22389/g.23059  ORF Transcript_22389/g.23059 Transcript_22389/m.23059 type:complete len:279 (+) Transcript_22389:57-893(+)